MGLEPDRSGFEAARRAQEILDRIPGAFERAQEGLAQAERGETTSLEDLDTEPEA